MTNNNPPQQKNDNKRFLEVQEPFSSKKVLGRRRLFYWFDAGRGELFLSEEELPGRKGDLYLVVNREELFFNEFSLRSGKRVKDGHVLSIQRHFVPFSGDFMNIIYSAERGEERRFYSWLGPLTLDVESYFYDEIPESLVFKGDPGTLERYNFFVFERVSGTEVIYFDGERFYSLFTKEAEAIVVEIVKLARKFSVRERIAIFTDTHIPGLNELPGFYKVTADVARNDDLYYFVPDFIAVKKRFSNISRNKQLKSIKTIRHQWNRNLTVIAALLFLVVLMNIIGMLWLKKDNERFKEQFEVVDRLDRRAEMIRFRLNKIKSKISGYPDHMLYLETVAKCMDLDSTLIGYSLESDRILMEGYSSDSLGLLTRLRKSKRFKDVRFKTTVTKNVYSQREKFEIEIVLFRRIRG
jgi:hypothetical protein